MKKHTMKDIKNAIKEDNLEKIVKEQLEKFRLMGMSIGSKAIAGVIIDILKKYDGNNASEVIQEAREFCETTMNLSERN